MTPLMFAIATDRPNPKTVELLLAKGADPKIRDKYGDDAIAWARKFQNKLVMTAMGLRAEEPFVVKLAGTPVEPDPRAAAEKALALLQKTNGTFLREGGMPGVSLSEYCWDGGASGQRRWSEGGSGKSSRKRHECAELHEAVRSGDAEGMQTPGSPDLDQYAVAQMKSAAVEPNLTIDTIILNEMRLQRTDLAGAHRWVR